MSDQNDDFWTEMQYKQIVQDEWNNRFLSDLGPIGNRLYLLLILAAIGYVLYLVFSVQLDPRNSLNSP